MSDLRQQFNARHVRKEPRVSNPASELTQADELLAQAVAGTGFLRLSSSRAARI